MRESVIQTTINKFLYWLAKRSVTALYKRTRFLTCSWGLDENTDLYLISEESYHDRHRFGVHEEKYGGTPQTESTGSPIGDYRDGVGAWQTDRMTEEEFDTMIAKGLLGQTDCDDRYAIRTDSGEVVAYACPLGCEHTDCGWGEPITVSHNEDKED